MNSALVGFETLLGTSASYRAMQWQSLWVVHPSRSGSWSGFWDLIRKTQMVPNRTKKATIYKHFSWTIFSSQYLEVCRLLSSPAPSSPCCFWCLCRSGRSGWEGLKVGPTLLKLDENSSIQYECNFFMDKHTDQAKEGTRDRIFPN